MSHLTAIIYKEKYFKRNINFEKFLFGYFSSVLNDFIDEIIDLYHALQKVGIDFEEKAFYDILKAIAIKYDFSYPEDKLLSLAKEVKIVVDDKSKYTDWNIREDIKVELKVDLIMLLAKHGYPPITKD